MIYADYLRPSNLNDALHALASGSCQVLAGGTDIYPTQSSTLFSDTGHLGSTQSHGANRHPASPATVLDITALKDLSGIELHDQYWRIGATTTWSTLVRAQLPPQLHGLQAAAREVGGIQIQNTGTIAGNICNASPAADGVPVLLSLDAEVELASVRGTRRSPLQDFLLGSRKTARHTDELVTAILIPHRPDAHSAFLKLGHRRYLVISIVMVSVVIEIQQGLLQHIALAVGSCSAVAQRLHALEQKLIGRPANSALVDVVHDDDLSVLSPIDDVRGTAEYRVDAALTLVRRAIAEAMHE
ncbi:MAG: xanthine dehydrogenase family protein subunit M [Betaproteobacteria bacterium]|nr:xanthine dehydrogenase family protein subunit M [Betaproteobacteria bacterium]